MDSIKNIIEDEIKKNDGILRLKPAWVSRTFSSPGKRLGLKDFEYDVGERGGICERWLASTTQADNPIFVKNEGISVLNIEHEVEVTLKDAEELYPHILMGKDYYEKNKGLNRLAKILDYSDRIPFHFHQMQEHAKLIGCNSKEEAYYFLEDADPGPKPETFFGVHPYIAEQKKYEVLLPHLINWKDDSILQHSKAYLQCPGDGYHVPAGTLHAPGTALTVEFQENSDVLSMLQAVTGNSKVDKELLFKDVRDEDRNKMGEKAVLEMINWEISGDPYFYENRHTPPIQINYKDNKEFEEYWIFYNTEKFSGKKILIPPGKKVNVKEYGAYNIFVWRGKGMFNNIEIEGASPFKDELFICHEKARSEILIENTGNETLIIFKFFGPHINNDVPMLKKYEK